MVRTRTTWFMVTALLLAAFLMMSGCGPSEPEEPTTPIADPDEPDEDVEKTLRIRAGTYITGMDPLHTTWAGDALAMNQVFCGLLRFTVGPEPVLEYDMAERHELSDDGLTWTFWLRQGIQWHHGRGEFTAHDVKAHYERLLDPDEGSAHRAFYTAINDIIVQDDYTISFVVDSPSLANESLFADFRGGFLTHADSTEEYPIGTGPYQIVEFVHREYVHLERNPDYYEGPPPIHNVRFMAIEEDTTAIMAVEAGDLEVIRHVADADYLRRLEANPMVNVHQIPSLTVHGIGFNLRKEPFNDLRVRQAIAHLIDQEVMVYNVRDGIGVVANVVLGPGYPYVGSEEEIGAKTYPYDPERAQQLLEEAGVTEMVATLEQGATLINEMFTILQDELNKIGVSLELQLFERAVHTEMRRTSDLTMALLGLTSRPDPDMKLRALLHSESWGGFNWTWYDGIDDLLDDARFEMDPEARKEKYHHILRVINEDLPMYTMYHGMNTDISHARVINWRVSLYPNQRAWECDIDLTK